MFEISQVTRKNSTVKDLKNAYEDVLKELPGFIRVLEDDSLISATKSRALELQKNYDQLVVLGVGGSSLGAKTIVDAFDCSDKVLFFENLDSFSFDRQLHKLKNLKRIHWVAISKSGTTIETLTQLQFVHQFYKEKGIDLNSQLTIVTEKKPSLLFDYAVANNIFVLEVPLDV